MDLYITHISFLPSMGEKEIEKTLEQGNRMLLFYSSQEHGMPTQILDYISEGKVAIKKLPDKLQNTVPLLAFEIGKAISDGNDRVILYGAYPMPELYRMLLSYDRKLVSKLFSKATYTEPKAPYADPNDKNEKEPVKKHKAPKKTDIKDRAKTPPRQKEGSSPVDIFGSLFESVDANGVKEKHGNTVKQDDSTGQEQSYPDKQKDAAPAQPNDKAYRESNKRDPKVKADNSAAPGHGIGKIGKMSKPPCPNPPEVVKKEVAVENYKKVSRTFQELLSEVCQEPVSEANAHGVMMSLVESMNCSNKEMMKEVYMKKLYEYFPGQKAKYFWAKTGTRFETLADYMLK